MENGTIIDIHVWVVAQKTERDLEIMSSFGRGKCAAKQRQQEEQDTNNHCQSLE